MTHKNFLPLSKAANEVQKTKKGCKLITQEEFLFSQLILKLILIGVFGFIAVMGSLYYILIIW